MQTNYIAEHPETHSEKNPILGEHPSKEKVALCIGSAMLFNTLVYKYVDDPYAWIYFATLTMVEFMVVDRNFQRGLKLTW